METRAACSDGSSAHCNFNAPWYYYQRRRFLRWAFFDTCLPLGVVAEIVIPIFIGIGTSSIVIILVTKAIFSYKMKSVPKSETRWKGYKICSLLLGNFGLRLMGFKQSCNGRWLIVFWLLKLLLIFIQFGQLLFSARSSLNLKQWATKGLGLAIRINPHAKMACSSDIWGKKLVEKSHFFSEILTEKSVVEKNSKTKILCPLLLSALELLP